MSFLVAREAKRLAYLRFPALGGDPKIDEVQTHRCTRKGEDDLLGQRGLLRPQNVSIQHHGISRFCAYTINLHLGSDAILLDMTPALKTCFKINTATYEVF